LQALEVEPLPTPARLAGTDGALECRLPTSSDGAALQEGRGQILGRRFLDIFAVGADRPLKEAERANIAAGRRAVGARLGMGFDEIRSSFGPAPTAIGAGGSGADGMRRPSRR